MSHDGQGVYVLKSETVSVRGANALLAESKSKHGSLVFLPAAAGDKSLSITGSEFAGCSLTMPPNRGWGPQTFSIRFVLDLVMTMSFIMKLISVKAEGFSFFLHLFSRLLLLLRPNPTPCYCLLPPQCLALTAI